MDEYSNKANYLYHNSTHKYYDVEGNIQLPVTVFLVQSEDRKILIDTGMSSTEIANKYHHPGSVQPEGYAIYEQLEKMGISCDEITDIIYTGIMFTILQCLRMQNYTHRERNTNLH